MPRNGSGVYAQPAGTSAVPNTIADPAAFNTLIADIGTEITGSLPRAGTAPMLGMLTLFASGSNPLHAVAVQQIWDTSGRALFSFDASGSTPSAPAAQTTIGGTQNPGFQIHGTTANGARASLVGWGQIPELQIGSSGGLTVGSLAGLGVLDYIGRIRFLQPTTGGSAAFNESARIEARNDNAGPGSGSTPARLSLYTTPSGSTTALERLRIDNGGTAWHFAAGSFPTFTNVNAGGVVISTGSSGFGANPLASVANDLVVESAANTGISIVAKNGQSSAIYFAKPSGNNGAFLSYTFAVTLTNEVLQAQSQGDIVFNAYAAEALRITRSSSQYRLQLQADATAWIYQSSAGGTGSISLASGSAERIRFDANGRTITSFDNSAGTLNSALVAIGTGGAGGPGWQLHGTSATGGQIGIYGWAAASIPSLVLFSSGSGTIGTYGRNASGDTIARIRIAGADGTNGVELAGFQWNIDPNGGAITAGNLPTVLHIYTSKATTAARNEVLRIDNGGTMVLFGQVSFPSWSPATGGFGVSTGSSGATSVAGAADDLVVEGSTNVGITLLGNNGNTGNIYFAKNGATAPGNITYSHSATAGQNYMYLGGEAGFKFGAQGVTQAQVLSGLGATALQGVAVSTGQSSLTAVGVAADDLVLESSGNTGMTIAIKNTTGNQGTINFAYAAVTNGGQITYVIDTGTVTNANFKITSEGDITFVGGGLATNVFKPGLNAVNNTTASAANVFVTGTGILQKSTSSLRYKTNVVDLDDARLDKFETLRPVTYQPKAGVGSEDISHLTFVGFIAEEVDAAGLPEFVQYTDDAAGNTRPDGLSYANMVAALHGLYHREKTARLALEKRLAAVEARAA